MNRKWPTKVGLFSREVGGRILLLGVTPALEVANLTAAKALLRLRGYEPRTNRSFREWVTK